MEKRHQYFQLVARESPPPPFTFPTSGRKLLVWAVGIRAVLAPGLASVSDVTDAALRWLAKLVGIVSLFLYISFRVDKDAGGVYGVRVTALLVLLLHVLVFVRALAAELWVEVHWSFSNLG